MEYILCEYDPNLSASNLMITEVGDKEYLKWDSSNECDIILVRSNFSQGITERLEELCELMERYLRDGEVVKEFVDIDELSVCIIPRLDNVGTLQRKYPVKQKGCRYSIYASKLQNDHTREIYKPMPVENPFNVISRDVPMKFEVSLTEEMIEKKKGIFGKEFVSSGFHSISFSENIDLSGYKDGDIYYSVNDTVVPITEKVIRTKTVYVKSATRPEIVSKNSGIKVEVV